MKWARWAFIIASEVSLGGSRMRVQATLTFPMKVAPEGATSLLRALRAFRAGAQYALDTILVKRLYRRVKDSYKVASLARLHKLLYGELKTRFGLPSRLAIDAIRYARSVAMTWLNNPNRGKRPTEEALHDTNQKAGLHVMAR